LQVAALLQNSLDSVVVTRSGLSAARFHSDVHTRHAGQAARASAASSCADNRDVARSVNVFPAAALGLKLESTKAPVGGGIIDKVAVPSEN
jgi:uncharacterized protein (TIGR03435 family)